MRRRYIILGVLALLALTLIVFYPFFLDTAARWLIVQDKLEKADAILVLAGDYSGERVQEGVNLYKQGWAKYLILSGGPLAWRLTYAEHMKRQAVFLGVPQNAILLQDGSKSTREDVELCLKIIKNKGFQFIILVSSPYHMRRAVRTFKKVFDKEKIKIIAYPAQKSVFNPQKWWLRHEDTAAVAWEYTALLLYLLKGY